MIGHEWALVETAEGRVKYTTLGGGDLDLVAASLLPLLRTALAGVVGCELRPVAVSLRYLTDATAAEMLLCTIHHEQGPGGVVLADVEVVGAVSARRFVRAEGILVPG